MTRFGRSQGFTLVEFILALTLGALAMAGVWVVFQERSDIVAGQVAVESITKIFDDVDRLTANGNTLQIKTTSGTLSTLNMLLYAQYINAVPTTSATGWVGADSLPQGVVLGGSFGSYTFSNAWGGTWSLSTTSSAVFPSITLDLITITMTGVPNRACTTIISDLSPGLYDTQVNGTLVGLTPVKTTTSPGRDRLKMSQALPLCAHNTNTLVLRRLKSYSVSQMRWGPAVLDTVNAHEGDQVTSVDVNGNPGYASRPGNVIANFNRIKAAMTARETAQLAIP